MRPRAHEGDLPGSGRYLLRCPVLCSSRTTRPHSLLVTPQLRRSKAFRNTVLPRPFPESLMPHLDAPVVRRHNSSIRRAVLLPHTNVIPWNPTAISNDGPSRADRGRPGKPVSARTRSGEELSVIRGSARGQVWDRLRIRVRSMFDRKVQNRDVTRMYHE